MPTRWPCACGGARVACALRPRRPLPTPDADAPPCALVLSGLLAVGGCGLFGPDTETLPFRPLLNSDTFVTGEPDVPRPVSGAVDRFGSQRSRVLVFRDTVAVRFFEETYAVAEPFPEVDFATESIVGYFLRDNRGDASVSIREIELRGDDTLVLTSDFTGVGVPPTEPASRFVVQLVAVPRLERPVLNFTSFNADRL